MVERSIKAPVTSSFAAARMRSRAQGAPMADGTAAAYRAGMRTLVATDANDTTQGSLAWSPPA